ncbi:hypothetical protein DD237_007832 [Peronospora effusa]|uniref:Uncharacterized protein n=1 Tax=Peronospora effusa TaxID=542832 RepID=A0A3R7W2S6_9STRA|nr:hypothetical protein DD237_007832 [Peronospora effusa]
MTCQGREAGSRVRAQRALEVVRVVHEHGEDRGRYSAGRGWPERWGRNPRLFLVDELRELGQLPLVFVVEVVETPTLACHTKLSWRRQGVLRRRRP